ncbi:hypothetical protein [Desulfovibrio sp.]|uniref:prenylated flavin chaperone LpdD n=1 Tax=Desulfovibrio sp. TaxID=885 RepID=UPI0025C60103|nr:hypothetical protein [Desulfovibrio sp.]
MKEGRLDLTLRLCPQGRDLHAILTGGDGHAGATALAAPGEATLVSERPGHREGALAGLVAGRLCAGLGCAVSVSCGIHFEAITRQEIAAVEKLGARLVEECLSSRHTRSENPC